MLCKAFAKVCSYLLSMYISTMLYVHRTNGKDEQFTQVLCKEWAFAMLFQKTYERNGKLLRCPSVYYGLRRRSALSGRSPHQQFHELVLNKVARHNIYEDQCAMESQEQLLHLYFRSLIFRYMRLKVVGIKFISSSRICKGFAAL